MDGVPGFKRLKLSQPVELSSEDFVELTENGRLTTSGMPGGEDLDPDGFEYVILSQVCHTNVHCYIVLTFPTCTVHTFFACQSRGLFSVLMLPAFTVAPHSDVRHPASAASQVHRQKGG